MATIKLEEISLKRFQDLLENLDVISKGENLYLRCWQGGGSYILSDDGEQSQEFEKMEELVEWLIEREKEVANGVIKPIQY